MNALDCDPCAESGLSRWFSTADELEAHITAQHPDTCARCESHQAENRRDRRLGRS